MSADLALDLFGYAASAVIAVSLMMTSVLRLRVLNLIGSVLFSIYAALIQAWPVVGLNLFIAATNVYFIAKLLRQQHTFSLLEVDADSAYLQRFLEYYEADIRRFVPGFRYVAGELQIRVFVLQDLVPAGLLIGSVRGRALEVQLDYATPGYRDLQVGRYLYGPGAAFFRDRGIQQFVHAPGAPEHNRYLRRIGYQESGERWERQVA